jgi:DUF3078 family protein
MLKLNPFLLLATTIFVSATLFAQNDDGKRLENLVKDEADSLGWTIGGGIGLDLGQILVLNPRAGSGQNRFGIGGAVAIFANYKNNRVTWNNNITLNLAIEKTGSGVIALPSGEASDQKVPFRKSIDELRVKSTYGYSVAEGSKWSYAVNFGFRSQLLSSYQGIDDGQIYVNEVKFDGPYINSLVSKFMAPGRFNLGIGMLYEPNSKFSFLLTPITGDIIVITDQDVANLGVHGTKLEDGSTTVYKTSRFAFGATLGAQYQDKYLNDRLILKSVLGLFSDYLDNPQNVDVSWTNELTFDIVGGLQLSFSTSLFYDDDVLSNVSDFNDVGGLERDANGDPVLRPAVNYYHQFLLKYVKTF